MTLLALEHVSRHYGRPPHKRVVLRDVSLTLEAGELVAIWGLRRCGRSTLLRVASGIEPPDRGRVRFAAKDLGRTAGGALGGGIGFCRRGGGEHGAGAVFDELLVAPLARGIPQSLARRRAFAALEEAKAGDCAARALHELNGAEEVRVAIATALVLQPALLVVDDPVKGVDLLQRDAILDLLRALADKGLGILTSAAEATALAGADRVLSLADGELRGAIVPEQANVVPLRRRASA
jgi:energy-coupling factor transporter ATP-binding protein EcfA2